MKERLPLGRVRRVMAKSMRHSVERAALSQISRQLDLTQVQQFRRSKPDGGQFSLNTYLLAAVARTLPAHPLLNAELVESQILVYEQINLGMAIAVPEGLVVAVIRDADRKSLVELAERSEKLANRALQQKLTLPDIEGGTFTVSNLGMFGVDAAFPLPRPPESAILLVGRAKPAPAAIQRQIVIRDLAWFSLTYDHRFIDGATGAAFLEDLQASLQNPEAL